MAGPVLPVVWLLVAAWFTADGAQTVGYANNQDGTPKTFPTKEVCEATIPHVQPPAEDAVVLCMTKDDYNGMIDELKKKGFKKVPDKSLKGDDV